MSSSEPDTAGWDDRVRAIYDYWRAIHRCVDSLPRRADFDPLDVPKLLPWIWLTDVYRDPIRFRYRLFGTRHCDAMGADYTGQWLDEAFPDFPGEPGYADYLQVAEQRRPSYRKGPAQYHVPNYRTIERILLPMVDDDDAVNMLLALTVYHDRIG